MSDTELMALAATDAAAAFHALAKRHQLKLAVRARLQFPALEHDIEDLIHDVFIEIWRKVARDIAEGRPPIEFAAYARTSLRSRCLDMVRRRRRLDFRDANDRADELLPPTLPPDPAANQRELKQGLAQLPREQALALVEVAVNGRTFSELGDELNEPISTLKTRVQDAKRKLRNMFGGKP